MTDAPHAPRGSALAAATAGAASVALGAGAGELAAGVLAPAASPFAVVGAALIDLAPTWAKDTAIALFGTADKVALLGGILLVAIALGAVAGLLDARWPPWGRVLVLVLAAAGVVAALTRSDAGALSWVPSAVAGVGAALALWALGRPLRARESPPPSPGDAGAIDRRRFFAWAGGAAAIGVLAAIGGTALRAGTQVSAAVRRALRLPAPAVTAAPIPAGAELGVLGLAPVVTPAEHFYRIDTALIVPDIDPADWSLRIHGLVDREVVITWDELLALPLEESWTTLVCVSNPVGGDLIGNAKWLGHPIRHLLERAGPRPSADMVLSRSHDGFTASTPLEVLTDPQRGALLAVGMNDAPLPPEHGFPVRMVVPGLYGYVSATKWVTELQVTRFDRATAYWTERGWSAQGPVKLQSRIDVPRRGQGLSPGEVVIAGVAWEPHVGISKVEVQVDGGPWREAELAVAISDDTWVQWSIPWTAERGDHAIRCRATNARGERQTEVDSWPAPDGATGWQQLNITVA
ncbi:molybdopterin-dependent oxidoreductase [Microbacterium sp.]|uniref:molybdopterin-dependent oxidoreductase n=1 Tax=Microbacterium sp. TaxID=51671 RepID=UPI0037CC3915